MHQGLVLTVWFKGVTARQFRKYFLKKQISGVFSVNVVLDYLEWVASATFSHPGAMYQCKIFDS
jgi:hypothetical protein